MHERNPQYTPKEKNNVINAAMPSSVNISSNAFDSFSRRIHRTDRNPYRQIFANYQRYFLASSRTKKFSENTLKKLFAVPAVLRIVYGKYVPIDMRKQDVPSSARPQFCRANADWLKRPKRRRGRVRGSIGVPAPRAGNYRKGINHALSRARSEAFRGRGLRARDWEEKKNKGTTPRPRW